MPRETFCHRWRRTGSSTTPHQALPRECPDPAGLRKLPHFTSRCPGHTLPSHGRVFGSWPAGRIAMLIRKLAAELLGTAVLVFFAVGTATLAFGFHLQGGSTAA